MAETTAADREQVDRSLAHSVKDGVWYSAMLGSAESYLSAFAVFLRASPTQIGVLASVPPLLAAFTQLFSAWLGRRLGRRRPIIVAGALLQATMLLPIALLPLVSADLAVVLLVVCVALYLVGPNIGSPQWGSLMGDLVPEARRGRFFARRTRLSSLATFSALLAAGLVLQGFTAVDATWLGFLVVFLCAAGCRLMSAWHLQQMHDPPGQVAVLEAPWHRELWQDGRASQLLRFSLFFACMQGAVAVASPFFTLYMLRDLEFSYLAFTLNTAASACMQFLTLNRWGRLSDLFGNRLILVTTGMVIPFLPALWLVSTNYIYLLLVQALSGVVWAGFSLSASNFVFDLTPRERRASLMAVHNVLAAVGLCLGAVAGGWLGTHLPTSLTLFGTSYDWLTPLYGVFALSALLRVLAAALFLPRLREVRSVRRMSKSGLVFRVTRVHSGSGLLFEAIGRRRRQRPEEPGEESGEQ